MVLIVSDRNSPLENLRILEKGLNHTYSPSCCVFDKVPPILLLQSSKVRNVSKPNGCNERRVINFADAARKRPPNADFRRSAASTTASSLLSGYSEENNRDEGALVDIFGRVYDLNQYTSFPVFSRGSSDASAPYSTSTRPAENSFERVFTSKRFNDRSWSGLQIRKSLSNGLSDGMPISNECCMPPRAEVRSRNIFRQFFAIRQRRKDNMNTCVSI